jgi:hypothetical protein
MNMNASSVTLKMPHLILTINGSSSSIEFALFKAGDSLQRILELTVWIGQLWAGCSAKKGAL